jgi:hypothetical protein
VDARFVFTLFVFKDSLSKSKICPESYSPRYPDDTAKPDYLFPCAWLMLALNPSGETVKQCFQAPVL